MTGEVLVSAPNILIVGGGRRSMRTALRLERLLRLGEATVVADPWSYMTYQPLLAEAAAGNLEPRHVVVPLCGVLRRTKVIKGAVSSVDHAQLPHLAGSPHLPPAEAADDEPVHARGLRLDAGAAVPAGDRLAERARTPAGELPDRAAGQLHRGVPRPAVLRRGKTH